MTHWLHFEHELPAGFEADELSAHWGRPGPWRIVRERGGLTLACDCPAAAEGAPFAAALRAWLGGCSASVGLAESEVAAGHELAASQPPRGAVAGTDRGLTPCGEGASSSGRHTESGQFPVHAGGLVATGQWLQAPRQALVYELGSLPRDPRRAALARCLCHDAMRRWRWVRMGLTPDGVLAAEIDLTGAPSAALVHLQPLAQAALQRVVAWVLPPLSLLLDPGAELRVLDPLPDAQLKGTEMVLKTLPLRADTVTGTRHLDLEVQHGLSAGAVARSIAERMSLPDDVAWALRDERAAFLVEDRPIGEQLGPNARVTITPRTHLGGNRG